MQGDIGAGKMIFGVEGVDPARRQQLIDLLEIDLEWRLNKVSDGQRRRVQICMGLLKPYQVSLWIWRRVLISSGVVILELCQQRAKNASVRPACMPEQRSTL